MTESTAATAIDRFKEDQKVIVNACYIYATYNSGNFNGFYNTEYAAKEHCKNNGVEFNDVYLQDLYKVYKPGDLFCVVGNNNVYVSNDVSKFIDPVADRSQLAFVNWIDPLTSEQRQRLEMLKGLNDLLEEAYPLEENQTMPLYYIAVDNEQGLIMKRNDQQFIKYSNYTIYQIVDDLSHLVKIVYALVTIAKEDKLKNQ